MHCANWEDQEVVSFDGSYHPVWGQQDQLVQARYAAPLLTCHMQGFSSFICIIRNTYVAPKKGGASIGGYTLRNDYCCWVAYSYRELSLGCGKCRDQAVWRMEVVCIPTSSVLEFALFI